MQPILSVAARRGSREAAETRQTAPVPASIVDKRLNSTQGFLAVVDGLG
jgi:hypothetical protein